METSPSLTGVLEAVDHYNDARARRPLREGAHEAAKMLAEYCLEKDLKGTTNYPLLRAVSELFGRTYLAPIIKEQFLPLISRDLRVTADLGCGTGWLTDEVRPVKNALLIDRPEVVKELQIGSSNFHSFGREEYSIDLEDGSDLFELHSLLSTRQVELVLLGDILHCLLQPAALVKSFGGAVSWALVIEQEVDFADRLLYEHLREDLGPDNRLLTFGGLSAIVFENWTLVHYLKLRQYAISLWRFGRDLNYD